MRQRVRTVLWFLTAALLFSALGCPAPGDGTQLDPQMESKAKSASTAAGTAVGTVFGTLMAKDMINPPTADVSFAALTDPTADDNLTISGDYSYTVATKAYTFTMVKVEFNNYVDTVNNYTINGTIWINNGEYKMTGSDLNLKFSLIGPMTITSDQGATEMKLNITYEITSAAVVIKGEYVVDNKTFTIDLSAPLS